LIIEVARPDLDEVEAMLGVLMPAGSYRDRGSGRLLVHSSRYDHLDRARRRARFTLRIDETGPGGARTVERRFDVRLFVQDELPDLARRTGLRLIADHGGFGGELRGAGSEVQVLRFEVAA
jgi:hypothetical protein